MKKIGKPIIGLIIAIVIIGILWWINSHRLDDYINNPQTDDIYIVYDKQTKIYAPFKITTIDKNQIWSVYYQFNFTDAVPDRVQILDLEFDYSTHFIYEKKELINMYNEGRIVEIYRD